MSEVKGRRIWVDWVALVGLALLVTTGLLATATLGSQPQAATQSQGAEILSARWEGNHEDAREWTVFTFEQIATEGPDLLNATPEDLLDFCPTSDMNEGDIRNFYVYLLSSVVQLESGFDPDTHYEEPTITDSQGRPVISRGLLQLSLESSNSSSYDCGFRSAADLHDPMQNLRCGIRILNHWVDRHGRIAGRIDGTWQGGAKYWSVLRTPERVDQIKEWTSTYCIEHFGR